MARKPRNQEARGLKERQFQPKVIPNKKRKLIRRKPIRVDE